MISPDIRVDLGFPHHRKTIRLRELGGQAAVGSLVQLWAWVATARTDGDLSGLPDRILESASGWDGEPGAFVDALVKSRFIDGQPSRRKLHGWAERQPFVAATETRSAIARLGGQAKAASLRSVSGTQRHPSDSKDGVETASGKTSTFGDGSDSPSNKDAVSENKHVLLPPSLPPNYKNPPTPLPRGARRRPDPSAIPDASAFAQLAAATERRRELYAEELAAGKSEREAMAAAQERFSQEAKP